ncbi:hypothetical protein ACL9RF_03740 [Sphingobacterium sp. Mn56C]|uniref:hypothetical protein n=1 Tax=Sphingobacterium sp. Mn56C TaxID=3395261 RepID=UPI003BE235A1
MDLLKLSTDWAKAEVFSAKIIALISIVILLGSLGFFIYGKTAMARAFVWPLFAAGLFMIAVSAGLYFANKPRIAQFEAAYQQNATQFAEAEIARTAKSQQDFTKVFIVLPLLIVAGAALILFLSSPTWRAIGISLAFLSTVLLLIDSNTEARNAAYHKQLKTITHGR